jgi:hypothetical protein
LKVLLLDTETAPHLAWVWGLWQQNVAVNQIEEAGHVLCWAAKWLGEDVQFASIQNGKPLQMLGKIHRLLDQADVVVHYNGKKFDIPTLNREFITHGMLPPSPYKQVDLLQTARSQFRFPSNKLEYLLKALKIGQKVQTGGFELWLGCMKGDKAAWEKMREYNIGDVIEMEKLYLKLLPWIKGHPNPALFSADKEMCPACGSHEYQHRGYARTGAYIYKRYQCKGCGKWFRGTKSEGGRQVQNVAA